MMSTLKQRLPSISTTSPASDSDSDSDNDNPTPPPPPPPRQQPSMGQRALASTAHLANLLPTGTLLAFQLLTPIFTHNGQCDITTRTMTSLLLAVLALSCFLASFTDSFRSPDGVVHYGVATFKGLWLFDYYTIGNNNSNKVNDDKYKLRFIDWVHAILTVLVFGVIALRDKNIVSCFYPQPSHQVQEVLDILPIGVGLLCSLLFVAFPSSRHGIGYPLSTS